jgi:membrane fusion protein (multidrug efflux system)
MTYIRTTKYFSYACIVSCLALACNDADQTTDDNEANNSELQKVEVVQPFMFEYNSEIVVTGNAMANQQTTIYAMEGGYVTRLNKDIGDLVRSGDVLAVLSNPELRTSYDEKKAQFESKELIYNRINSIYEKTPALTTVQLLDEARGEYLRAKANLEAIENRIGFLQIRAPFKGVVTKRMVDKGALVQSGISQNNPQALFEVQDINPIRIVVPLPESDIASVSKNTKAMVHFPDLGGEPILAVVSRTSGALDPNSKTMQIEIDVNNDSRKIVPGMYAKVELKRPEKGEVLSLPKTAQLIDKTKVSVYAVRNNEVVKLEVQSGQSDNINFEVTHSDLKPNDQVIVQGKNLVKPGDMVEPLLKK